DPGGQGCQAVSVGVPGLGVGEFGEQGAVEAFGFAVGPGAAGFDVAAAQPEGGADRGPAGAAAVDKGVVGQDSQHGDAVVAEPGHGAVQERGGGGVAFVGQGFDVGQAGVAVDGDVQVVVADTAAADLLAAAVHP